MCEKCGTTYYRKNVLKQHILKCDGVPVQYIKNNIRSEQAPPVYRPIVSSKPGALHQPKVSLSAIITRF